VIDDVICQIRASPRCVSQRRRSCMSIRRRGKDAVREVKLTLSTPELNAAGRRLAVGKDYYSERPLTCVQMPYDKCRGQVEDGGGNEGRLSEERVKNAIGRGDPQNNSYILHLPNR